MVYSASIKLNVVCANYALTFLLFIGMLYDFWTNLMPFASTLEGPFWLDGSYLLWVLGFPLLEHLVVTGLAPIAGLVLVPAVVSKLTQGLLYKAPLTETC
jgi:hypothetical protein